MHPKLKKMEKREDGFLVVELKRKEEFDDYLYTLLLEDQSCIPCIKDPMQPQLLYYDLSKGVRLPTYLEGHSFVEGEFLSFTIFLLETFLRVNVSKPIYISLDYVFLFEKQVQFLVLPLQGDGWNNQGKHMQRFIRNLLKAVQTTQDYATIGFLYQRLKDDDLQLASFVHDCKVYQEKQITKLPFWQRLLVNRQEYQLTGLPVVAQRQVQSFYQPPDKTASSSSLLETVMLVSNYAYLEDVQTQQQFPLCSKEVTIGRSPDNEIVLLQDNISAYHAIIDTTTWRITDLHSRNGTLVNKKRITETILKDQDRIQFADACYIVHRMDAQYDHT